MLDFDVQRCTRKCAETDRELRPGETVYSTLVSDGGEIKRVDYSAEAWSGPPEGILGWWEFAVPDHQAGKLKWAPSDVIRNYFQQLVESKTEADKLYVLALLLVRRRLMRLEETETDSEGRETLVLYCPKEEAEYSVVVSVPAPDRVKIIQDELAQLLFAGTGPLAPSAEAEEVESTESGDTSESAPVHPETDDS